MPCYAAMLCYAMLLCYVMLCHVTLLCYPMPCCYAMLCYAMLGYAMQCYNVLRSVRCLPPSPCNSMQKDNHRCPHHHHHPRHPHHHHHHHSKMLKYGWNFLSYFIFASVFLCILVFVFCLIFVDVFVCILVFVLCIKVQFWGKKSWGKVALQMSYSQVAKVAAVFQPAEYRCRTANIRKKLKYKVIKHKIKKYKNIARWAKLL